MNGFVTIEAGAFTGSGFVMEHRSAVTEVTKTAAAISGAQLKNSLAEIYSVFRLYSVAMAMTIAVMRATKGIVLLPPHVLVLHFRQQQLKRRGRIPQYQLMLIRLLHLLCVKQISLDVAAA